jgi:hypothetical protein
MDEPEANAESQASPFTGRLGRVKGVAGAIQVDEAGTGILNAQFDALTPPGNVDENRFFHAFFHGVEGVIQQVEQDLLQLIGAYSYVGKIGLDFHLHGHAAGRKEYWEPSAC